MTIRNRDKTRLSQLNAEVYKHVTRYSAYAGDLFKEAALKEGVLDEFAVQRIDQDALFLKWNSVVSLSLKNKENEVCIQKLEDHLKLYQLISHAGDCPSKDVLPLPQPALSFQQYTQAIRCIAFHPVVPLLACGDEHGFILILDHKHDRKLKKIVRDHDDAVVDLSFHCTGKYLASASIDTTIKIWSSIDFQCIRTLYGHSSAVSAVAFLDSSMNLLSASIDATVRMWDGGSGICLSVYTNYMDTFRGLAVCRKSRLCSQTVFAGVGNKGSFYVWSLDKAPKAKPKQYSPHSHAIECISFATEDMLKCIKRIRGNSTVPSVSTSHRMTPATSQPLSDLTLQQDPLMSVSDIVISASRDKTLKIWNTRNNVELFTFTGHQGWIKQFIIHPSGERLISCSDDKSIRVWDIATESCCLTIAHHQLTFLSCLAWDTQTSSLATGDVMGTVLIWECSDKENQEIQPQLNGQNVPPLTNPYGQ